jgi:hypothetical protein
MGNVSRSSKSSTNSWIWSPLSPLRAGIWVHSECLRLLTVAAEDRELKLDQTFVSDSGGTVETRILIVCDREVVCRRDRLVWVMSTGL